MSDYKAQNKKDKNGSSLKDKIGDKAGSAALQGLGIPKPLADLAMKHKDKIKPPLGGSPFSKNKSPFSNKGKNNPASKKENEAEESKNKKESSNKKSPLNKVKEAQDAINGMSNDDGSLTLQGKIQVLKIVLSAAPIVVVLVLMIMIVSLISGVIGGFSEILPIDNLFSITPQAAELSSSNSDNNDSNTIDENAPADIGKGEYGNPIRKGFNITTPFGKRGSMWKSCGYHTGSDFAAGKGTPIYSITDGTVVCSGSCAGAAFGNCVIIKHSDGKYSLYAHMRDTPLVSKGQSVKHSTKLGVVGATGNVSGPHLHLEIWDQYPWTNKCSSHNLNPAKYVSINK